jgi:hypothetical protein
MRREQIEAAAVQDLLQASVMRERKAAAARARKGAAGAKGTTTTGAQVTTAAGARSGVSVPPPSEGTAGAFDSPASFTGGSTFSSRFTSTANADGSANGGFWTQGIGCSLTDPWMRHQAFDTSTW